MIFSEREKPYSGRRIKGQRGRVQILFDFNYLFIFCLLEGVQSRSSTPVNTPLLNLLHAEELIYKGKSKGISNTGHEGPRGMGMKMSTYSQPRH